MFDNCLNNTKWCEMDKIVPGVKDEHNGNFPWEFSCRRRLKLAQVSTQGTYERVQLNLESIVKQPLSRN